MVDQKEAEQPNAEVIEEIQTAAGSNAQFSTGEAARLQFDWPCSNFENAVEEAAISKHLWRLLLLLRTIRLARLPISEASARVGTASAIRCRTVPAVVSILGAISSAACLASAARSEMHILLWCNPAAASNARVWSPGLSRASGGCQTLRQCGVCVPEGAVLAAVFP